MEGKRICKKCIMDETVPDISFDETGECNYCKLHRRMEEKFSDPNGQKLAGMVEEIKKRGSGKKYGCIVGVSGGCDSTYLLRWAVQEGLRPLALHLDNGWNSTIAEENMKRAVEKLGVDLKIVAVEPGEFLDLQLAFLKASVPDVEVPTDIGIYATVFKTAAEMGIPSVLNGHSYQTEGTVPMGWTYMDGKYLEDVYRRHGSRKRLEHFNNLRMLDVLSYSFVKKIREYRPLEYLKYDKKAAAGLLAKELGWKDYGGHHYESVYTRFVASYILVEKFGIDKRKVSYSARIRSGLMTREEALKLMGEPPYPPEKVEEDMALVTKKFGMGIDEFQDIMRMPVRSFRDYRSYHSTLHTLKPLVKMAVKMGLVSEMVYEKYAK